jgi:hypothetical protein
LEAWQWPWPASADLWDDVQESYGDVQDSDFFSRYCGVVGEDPAGAEADADVDMDLLPEDATVASADGPAAPAAASPPVVFLPLGAGLTECIPLSTDVFKRMFHHVNADGTVWEPPMNTIRNHFKRSKGAPFAVLSDDSPAQVAARKVYSDAGYQLQIGTKFVAMAAASRYLGFDDRAAAAPGESAEGERSYGRRV